MFAYALYGETFSHIRNCSIYVENFFTCSPFLSIFHTALSSLLKALPKLKKRKFRIKVVAIFSLIFTSLDLKPAFNLVSLNYE